MDSLAALALATDMPKPHLLERPPQQRDDHIVSRKMLKHIIYMAAFQCVVLFIFIYAGEYIVMEPKEEYQYLDYPYSNPGYVFPGRKQTLGGDPVYQTIKDKTDEDSRHMTWIFHFFVFLQIWNMVCSRKIHDELNVFAGICSNLPFLLVWAFIVLMQLALIQWTGKFFHLHTDGLSWEQQLEAIVFALSVFIVNFILKLMPDSIICFQVGPDSVYDRS